MVRSSDPGRSRPDVAPTELHAFCLAVAINMSLLRSLSYIAVSPIRRLRSRVPRVFMSPPRIELGFKV